MTPIDSLPETTDTTACPPTSRKRGRRRRRWTREQKADLLARFAASGATAAQFCRETGLSEGTFSAWCRRHPASQGKGGPGGFAQVRLPAATSQAGAAAPVLVEVRGGINVSVPVGTDALWLAQVLHALREG